MTGNIELFTGGNARRDEPVVAQGSLVAGGSGALQGARLASCLHKELFTRSAIEQRTLNDSSHEPTSTH